MRKLASPAKRFKGHAETPYIVGLGSIVFGLVWATILVAKHDEFALYFKILVFILSPLVGLLFVITFIAFILAAGFIGEWMDKQIAKLRHSRKS
jgi:uncharacterized membrane protein (DUF485 family)